VVVGRLTQLLGIPANHVNPGLQSEACDRAMECVCSFGPPVHENKPKIWSRHRNHQPRNPCSRPEVGTRLGVRG